MDSKFMLNQNRNYIPIDSVVINAKGTIYTLFKCKLDDT